MSEELKVVAVRKDEYGDLAEFKLNTGEVVDFANCQKLINEGKLDLIRSKPDGDPNNNLSALPEF